MAQNVTIAGAAYSAVPAVSLPKTGGGTATYVDTTDADAVARDIRSGKTAYAGGVKITGTLVPGTSTFITKTATANGVYEAASDNADGYSTFTVAIQEYDGSVS